MHDRPFTVAMVVPTGIGARIGGHAGDATAAARLLAAACDRLIVHPNVVNASDLNEMTDNMLYVEGWALDAWLRGDIVLRPSRSNRVLVVCNSPAPCTVNAVNSARSLLGLNAQVLVLQTPLVMRGWIGADRKATGEITGLEEMFAELATVSAVRRPFDALAVHTPVEVDREAARDYLRAPTGRVNPWGGVEAMLSREVSERVACPVAHAPVETMEDFPLMLAEPSLAPEMLGGSHLYSVLHGLHRAPGLELATANRVGDIARWELDALVSAVCHGEPHEACIRLRIPILYVAENQTTQVTPFEVPGKIMCRNYLEAAGHLVAMRAGVDPAMVQRPVPRLNIHREISDD